MLLLQRVAKREFWNHLVAILSTGLIDPDEIGLVQFANDPQYGPLRNTYELSDVPYACIRLLPDRQQDMRMIGEKRPG